MTQIAKTLFFLAILALIEPSIFGTEYIQTVLGYIVIAPLYIALTLAAWAGDLIGWISG